MEEIIEGNEYTREELNDNGWKYIEIFATGKEVFMKGKEELVWEEETGIVVLKYESYKKRDK